MREVVVTGASGQVGREVARCLQSLGVSNRLLVRDPEKGSFLSHNSSHIFHFDWTNPETFAHPLKGAESLFLVSPGVDEKCIATFLGLAKESGLQRIVVMSGMGADQSEVHFLADLENLAEASGIPFIALQANWFFQNFGSFFRDMIRKNHALTFPDGEAPISFVDTRDIAEVAAHFLTTPLEKEKRVLTITGPESLTHAQVATLFSKHLPYPVTYEQISEKEAIERLGWDEIFLSLFRDIRNKITAPVSPDVEKVLGKPPRCLEPYIKEHLSLWT